MIYEYLQKLYRLIKKYCKNFNNKEFDDVIKRILSKIFHNYYVNRENIFIVLIIYTINIIFLNIIL